MFKFGTIGAFKLARNNPRCKALAKLSNGLIVIPDDITGNAPTPATLPDAKGKNLWVVNNIIDKPEIYTLGTGFYISTGEFVRAYLLADLIGLPVEIDSSVVTTDYTTIAVGDILVSDSDGSGKWIKADGTVIVAANYKVQLKVEEKSTFMDKGLYCFVVVN